MNAYFLPSVKSIAMMGTASMLLIPGSTFAEDQDDGNHDLTIMSTTDIHSNVMAYDYMNDEEVDDYGLAKTATLIEQVRAENDNTILFDSGDTIEGSMLGELETLVEPIEEDETQAVIKAMNELDYAAAGVGNHEFNFGLDFLDQTVESSDFPWLSANVYEAGTDREEHYYDPYTIIEHEVDGKDIDIGVIGFVPPQIMEWDNLHLEGDVEVRDIVESAERYLPELEEQSDIVVALAHTGISEDDDDKENAGVPLAEVDGIDALLLGHNHNTFPGHSDYDEIEGVDDENGTIHDVPAVMAGDWGSHLGTIELNLTEDNGEWSIEDAASDVTSVEGAEENDEIVALTEDVHERTLDHINEEVGSISDDVNTFFSRVMDNEVLQLVNDAQMWFAEDYFSDTEYEEKPLLSAAAPFRANGDYTEVDEGEVTIGNLADIYVYPNTLQVVDIDGDELKQWLERSAENFEQIDPEESSDQDLLASFSSYNFDVIEGVEYYLDVTQPEGERVQALTYEGDPVTADMEFLVATNNYRAGGGGGHLEDADIVEELVDENLQNRQVVAEYMEDMEEYDPHVTNNWSLYPADTAGDVTFTSSIEGVDHIDRHELDEVSFTGDYDGDEASYTYNFSESDSISASLLQDVVEQLEEDGAFANSEAVHTLDLHLRAVGHYEDQGDTDKVVDHMGGFHDLLDHQLENQWISEGGFETLQSLADDLIAAYDGTFSMNIYHTNDNHANTEMFPQLVTTLDEAKDEHGDGLLLDAGDVFTGTIYFNEFYGQDSLEFMNLMDYDAFVPGNHEFDLGDSEEGHPELVDFIDDAEFPVLGANMDFSEDEGLNQLTTDGISEEAEEGMIHDGIILEHEGEDIGVFGLNTEDTVDISSPMDVEFSDYAQAAQDMVDQFEDEGIDKIIALTHLGYDSDPSVGNDLLLAEQVEEIDVIVGGHSHTALEELTIVTENEDGEEMDPTVIGQAGEYGEHLGRMNVTFDEDGVITEADGELMDTEEREPDPEAQDILDPYQDTIEDIQNEEVGATVVNDLPNPRHGDGDDESVRADETALGNLISDAQLEAAQLTDEDTMMALQNGGGIRTSIETGEVTVGDIIEVQPFGNRLTLLELSGEELIETFEASVSNSPEENGGFLQISGDTRLTYDSSQDPGERVETLEVNMDGEYEEIAEDDMYTVATNNFTATGGDGHDVLGDAYDDGRGTIVGDTDWEMLRDYMVELEEVDYEVEDRIQDVADE
ncbi:bifunctional 2',3'-cyclic-nucleotide 2'-phosphodiesterase/3'-nucleotidase [Salicibibacter halophilus]|nr:bifunctional 2',3'-cyclic-nucleotide 2'-phosphodiesterase/3'-nucleotidase [Salicibibacter halophilus]